MLDQLESNIDEQRQLVLQILESSGKPELIKQCVENGDIVLKPDLDISCNVGAQTDVLTMLQAFNPSYLHLVLEAVLKIRIDYVDEPKFVEQLDKSTHKYIFHSPAIAKNKKYVYTRGNWLTEEGKKAVERHFLYVMCQIFYLMEQCVIQRVIPDGDHMFKPETPFKSMNDIFSFMSRELIGGKTLFPRVMENIGFKPTHHDPINELDHSSFIRPCARSHNQSLQSEHFKTAPSSTKKVPTQPLYAKNDRIQQRLLREAEDTRVGELFNQIDQTDINSFLGQTQATVENIEKHVQGLTDYQTSIQALYDQLKHTAKFLTDIVHSLGLNDAQIELIMQKINQLHLDIQETGEISTKLADNTRQIVAELSVFSFRLEQSMRNSMLEPIQSSFVDISRANNKALDDLIAKNKALSASNLEFVEKQNQFQSEIDTLQRKIETVQLEKDNFEQQVNSLSAHKQSVEHQLNSVTSEKELIEQQLSVMTRAKEEFEQKYTNALKLLTERENQLENRENLIQELQTATNKQKLPVGLEKEIENQLQKIYSTMSDVTNHVHER